MQTPTDSILAYLHAKDCNRPHRMPQAFAEDASLRMVVRKGGIAFPPLSSGREAISETLVRRFGQTYENIYTFCLAEPPAAQARAFHCAWLVAMSEKDGRAVRVGCGRYDWRFSAASGLAQHLEIRIDAMQSLSPDHLADVLDWVTRLPSPWCPLDEALRAAPSLRGVSEVLSCLADTVTAEPAM